MTLAQYALKNRHPYPILAAYVNGEIRELSYTLKEGESFRWIDQRDSDGIRILQRGLTFLFYIALRELFPDKEMDLLHSLSEGLYFEVSGEPLHRSDIRRIWERMEELRLADLPFLKREMSIPEAADRYDAHGLHWKKDIIVYKHNPVATMYELNGYIHYFFGYMPASTGALPAFELMSYAPGLILRHPTQSHPWGIPPFVEQPKLHGVFMESGLWANLLGVSDVSQLNAIVAEENKIRELIQVQEALQEKKIAHIADMIKEKNSRVILVAGPSSSGKTTFTHRLKIQLMANGVFPESISLDNYFINRVNTPLDEDGNPDYESLVALDLQQLNRDLTLLLEGEEVSLPIYDFLTGKRSSDVIVMQLAPDQPIILEGIHGLNDQLTPDIHSKDKFKVYISALTQLNLDRHNRIPTTDNRLIRRMVRDYATRGHSAEQTIEMWPSVQRGESRHIFPFQESADAIFNSALVYELAVLKKTALPLLEEIKQGSPIYAQAKRLKKFLYYFESIDDDSWVPSTSLLREFIGGSSILP